ncbi:MAG: GEVED domain-containing protein, partial [Cyanobacteria bacterium J06592_8]
MSLTSVQSKFNLQFSTVEMARTIVFIDEQVPNAPQLIEGGLPGIKIVKLDGHKDGIQQITETLRNYPQISTVHIVSHGAPGCLYLGNSQLSLDTLAEYSQQLQSWFSLTEISPLNLPELGHSPLNPPKLGDLNCEALADSPQNWGARGANPQSWEARRATLILYGCNVAAGDAGEEFIEKLHQITGAEIAASTTKTGHTSQGGNWNLEIKTSEFEVQPIFTSATQQNWPGILIDITGTAFLDYNSDGTRQTPTGDLDNADEVGLENVRVTAIGEDGSVVGTTTTNANGDYTLTVPDNTPVRLEFSNVPSSFVNGSLANADPNTVSNVAFVEAGTTDVTANLGVHRPSDVTDGTIELVTACYVFALGDPANNGNDAALIKFDYDLSGNPNSTPGTPSPPYGTDGVLATVSQVGTVGGIAYQRETDNYFGGALMKRHSAFGPGGTGAIYRIDDSGATPVVTTFTTLNAGTDPHVTTPTTDPNYVDDWELDAASFPEVTKIGLGDLDISEDGTTLYTVNLLDRQLYQIPIGDAVDPLNPDNFDPANISQIDFIDLILTDDSNALGNVGDATARENIRPFGLGVRDGLIYAGIVNTAQNTQQQDDLEAFVYSIDPANPTVTPVQVLSFGLDYDRDPVVDDGSGREEWLPWTDTFPSGITGGEPPYPQPILADIEFDNNGDMILGFRDRWGDQNGGFTLDPGGTIRSSAVSGGDILRADANDPFNPTAWTIETEISTGDEFYTGDFLETVDSTFTGSGTIIETTPDTAFHQETAQGGLAFVPGYGEVASTALDPIDEFSGGIEWFSNADGTQQHPVERDDRNGGTVSANGLDIYNGIYFGNTSDSFVFSKANGLGDLEWVGDAPTTTIGGRLWIDSNENGIQDAGEIAVPDGVTVELYDDGGTLITNTTTTNGNYFFSDPNIAPFTDYEVRLVSTDFQGGGLLEDFDLSPADQGINDLLDSDATLVDIGGGVLVPVITPIEVGASATNDYSLDVGVFKNDYGDAPVTYPTLKVDNGASHGITSGIQIGSAVPDIDTDGFVDGTDDNNNATDDDVTDTGTPNDENTFGGANPLPTLSTASSSYTLNVPVTNTTGSDGTLVGWIDLNQNDTFEANEGVTVAVPDGTNNTDVTLTWNATTAPEFSNITEGTSYLRLRLSTDSTINGIAFGTGTPGGAAVNGEVEDYEIEIFPVDFGDSPSAYGTLTADNGPSHIIVSGLQIGTTAPDAEPDGFGGGAEDTANPATEDDNTNIDDEDTFTTLPSLAIGSTDYTLSVPVTNTIGTDGTLSGWIDFDQNNSFDAGEIATVTVPDATNNTTVDLNWTGLTGLTAGETFVRLRLSTDPGLTPLGAASNGEVEGYPLEIVQPLDFGDAPSAPNNTYPTLLADDGPRHAIVTGLQIGPTAPDADTDGFGDGSEDSPSTATDDDQKGTAPNDEDTFATLPILTEGDANYTLTVPVTNTTGAAANLVGWIDFDQDGIFQTDEEITAPVPDGTNNGDITLTWDTANSPGFADLTAGITFVRLRLSTDTGLLPTGAAADGEVEDYQLSVDPPTPLDFGDAPDSYGTLEASGGPRHEIVAGLQLGAEAPDQDTDGFGDGSEDSPNTATDDDLKGTTPDDEDAIDPANIPELAVTTTTYTLDNIPVVNTTGNTANLLAWIDFDGDGVFQSDEGTTVTVNDGDTTASLTWSDIGTTGPDIIDGTSYIRFRLTTNTLTTSEPGGVATDGEVEDFQITIAGLIKDFGDAPVSYGDASHIVNANLNLGTAVTDVEAASQPTSNADGDDLNGTTPDDEDAFAAPLTLSASDSTYTLTVPLENTTGNTATLVGWIDFDGDGAFQDDEAVSTTVADSATEGILTWNNIGGIGGPDIVPGTSYARFRLSTDTNLTPATPDGLVSDGEVEDFLVTIEGTNLDFGDSPATYGNPSHGINQDLGIGTAVIDAEDDGQPTPNADGDDLNGTTPDDEDGFDVTPLPILTTETTSYVVTVPVENNTGNDATLVGWIDFNLDGTFEPQEGVSATVPDGTTSIPLTWDTTTAPGITNIQFGESFVRFRISTDSLDSNTPGTQVSDGEVEDYALTILAPPTVDLDGNDPNTTDFTTVFNNTPVPIGNNVQVADPDSPNIAQAVITLTNPQDPGAEVLNLDPANVPAGITVTGEGTATITLTGDVPPTDYQTAIEAITYNNTVTIPNDTPRIVTVQVTDPDTLTSNVAQTTIEFDSQDFGDAPATYGTPSHSIVQTIGLGTAEIDAEAASQPTPDADGDDINGTTPDDEDAFTTLTPLAVNATSYSLTVPVENTTGNPATLVGWIDFDGDGAYQADEGVSATINDGDTIANLTWDATTAPGFSEITTGTSYVRFRISTDPLTTGDFDGVATNGEVEDYSLIIGAPPTVDLDGDNDGTDFTTPFTGTPIAIGNNVQVADPDSPIITQATITLTNPQDGVAETLNIDPANLPRDISIISNDGITIVLGGNATPETYATVIESITYSNSAANPNETPRTIEVQVTDPDNLTSNTAQTTITLAPTDFGDAPATYGNPSHGINQDVGLGTATIDAEAGGQPTVDASGDDVTNIDDEDAFTTLPTLATNTTTYSITVPVTNNTGGNVNVAAWIDFNLDGTFQNDEGVNTTVADGSNTGTLSWDATTAPGLLDITNGVSYARFRISTDPNLTAIDAATDGEVEDYTLTILAPPTVDLDGDNDGTDFTTPFTGTPIAIGNNVQVTDPDSPNISQAVITLTNPEDGTAETLDIDPANVPAGITVTGNGTSTITLSGDATPLDYQGVIEAITYNNTAPNPNPSPR